MNNTLGIIVREPKHYVALKARFRDDFTILKSDGPGGNNMSPADILMAAKKQIAILQLQNTSAILMLVDCESPRRSYAKFFRELCLRAKTIGQGKPIHVAMPNRTIENWYLADIERLARKKKGLLKSNVKQKNFEGKNGRTVLRKLFHKGVNFDEVNEGAKLFTFIRFKVARANSRSFEAFYDVIERYL